MSRQPKPMEAPAVVRIGHYKLLYTIGKGSFGKVKLAEHERTGHRVAVKIISRNKIKSSQMDRKIRREINILKLFRHPHIISLYEVIETKSDIFMVMEYVNGGELFDYIVARGRLSPGEARKFFQQIISGVEYCHLFRVAHRDLKPENLLLDSKNNVKLADFGLSNVMSDGDFLKTSCGSPNYAAPEVISGKLYAGPEVDVWSCGVILYALLCGRLPFDEDNIPALFRKIRECDYTIPFHVPGQAKDLIKRMLVADPLKRVSIEEIRQHEWFQEDIPDYIAEIPDISNQQMEIDGEILDEVVAKMGCTHEQAILALQDDEMNDITVAYRLIGDHRTRFSKREDVPVPPIASPPAHAFSMGVGSPIGGLGSPYGHPEGNLGATPSSVGRTMRPVEVGHAPEDMAEWQWRLGLHSRKTPHEMMAELYRVLHAHDFDWRALGEFHLKCRYPKLVEVDSVKIGVQLFVVPEGGYLLEMRKLDGATFPFLDACSMLYSDLSL